MDFKLPLTSEVLTRGVVLPVACFRGNPELHPEQ